MSRNRTKAEEAAPCVRLADLLMDAHIRAYARHNSMHRDPAYVAVCRLGVVGYRDVARELLALGVRLPEGE